MALQRFWHRFWNSSIREIPNGADATPQSVTNGRSMPPGQVSTSFDQSESISQLWSSVSWLISIELSQFLKFLAQQAWNRSKLGCPTQNRAPYAFFDWFRSLKSETDCWFDQYRERYTRSRCTTGIHKNQDHFWELGVWKYATRSSMLNTLQTRCDFQR